MVEKIGSEDRFANLCYHKNPGKRASESKVGDERLPSKCGNVLTICSLKIEMKLSVLSVSWREKEHTDSCACVYKEGEIVSGVMYL